MSISENVKKLSNEKLESEIKLGRNSFQEGVFEIYLKEARERNLNIEEEKVNSINRISYDVTSLIKQIENVNLLPNKFKLGKILGLISFISLVSIFINFQVLQLFPKNQLVQNISTIILGIFSIGILTFPISYLYNIYKIYNTIQKFDELSVGSFVIPPGEIIIGLFVPFIHLIFIFSIIKRLNYRLYTIRNYVNLIPVKEKTKLTVISIGQTLFYGYSIYVLFENIRNEIIKKKLS